MLVLSLHGNRNGSTCQCSYISMFVASPLRMRTDNTEPRSFDVHARVERRSARTASSCERNNAETGSKGAFTVSTRLCSLNYYVLPSRSTSIINTSSAQPYSIYTKQSKVCLSHFFTSRRFLLFKC